ncbi:MAG TPA: TolC family protein [Saprospiraceae bacterium]|nr:TolC family protein [Saprospiraceae bacterium]
MLNRHKSLLLVVVWCCLSALSAAGQTSPMSLSDCVRYALENHPNVKVAQLQVADADWRVKESKATGLPQLSAGLSYNYFIQRGGLPSSALGFGASGPIDLSPALPSFSADQAAELSRVFGSIFASDPDSKVYFNSVHGASGSVSANQLIFNNSYLVALKAARYYRQYVELQLGAAKETVRNQVTDAYLPALLLSENLAILDKNIGNLDKLLSDTRAINKAGFAEQLDVDRLDLSLANLRSERGNLARQREIVVSALKMAMGMPVGTEISLSDDLNALLKTYADADLTTAVNPMNHPEYLQLLKGRDLAALQIDLYRKPWMPTVLGFVQWQGGLQGGFGAKDSPTHNKWFFIPSAVAGLSVSVPLYDGGGSKAKRERALIQVQTIDAQKQMLENAIQLQAESARKQYANAAERVSNQQKNLALAQRIYDTTQTKYKAGIGSSFEITQAEQGLYSAQQALMTAQFDLLNAKVAIKKALGISTGQ